MKIFKTMIFHEGEPSVYAVDTIKYQDAFWLVTEWRDTPSERKKQPARIIRMDSEWLHTIPEGGPADFELERPMPRAVFDDEILSIELKDMFVVIEEPEIYLKYNELL